MKNTRTLQLVNGGFQLYFGVERGKSAMFQMVAFVFLRSPVLENHKGEKDTRAMDGCSSWVPKKT